MHRIRRLVGGLRERTGTLAGLLVVALAVWVATSMGESIARQSAARTKVASLPPSRWQSGDSFLSSMSGSGRRVAFDSAAAKGPRPARAGEINVFVHGFPCNCTRLVSSTPSGSPGNGESRLGRHAISSSGRLVVFTSAASNLVRHDSNGASDVFVRNLKTSLTRRISVDSNGDQANRSSFQPAISANGRYVVFVSPASNLVEGDARGSEDIFVHDRRTGTTRLIDRNLRTGRPVGHSLLPSISAAGHAVAFASGSDRLIRRDTNGMQDIFLTRVPSGRTVRVSVGPGDRQGNGQSFATALSDDGHQVAFESGSTNLVRHDRNMAIDIFVHNTLSGVTKRMDVDSNGHEANAPAQSPAFSPDGQFVAFDSVASNIVPGDTNGVVDTFVHNRATGVTRRVSLKSSGDQALLGGAFPSVSKHGRFVAFDSFDHHLVSGDDNRAEDVFRRGRLRWHRRQAAGA